MMTKPIRPQGLIPPFLAMPCMANSNVQAGFVMGSATVARLHSNPVFRADLRAAAGEVETLRKNNGQGNTNCSLELEALRR